jgi:hypothetical protein
MSQTYHLITSTIEFAPFLLVFFCHPLLFFSCRRAFEEALPPTFPARLHLLDLPAFVSRLLVPPSSRGSLSFFGFFACVSRAHHVAGFGAPPYLCEHHHLWNLGCLSTSNPSLIPSDLTSNLSLNPILDLVRFDTNFFFLVFMYTVWRLPP